MPQWFIEVMILGGVFITIAVICHFADKGGWK
jgi:hypothetical protein